MSELSIIPFRAEHLGLLQARKFEAHEMELLGDPANRVREYLRGGAAYTGIVKGQVMGCAGIFPLWRGVAEVWMITTDLVSRYPKAFHQAIANGLEIAGHSMGLWRIQTAVHQNHLVSQKWLRRLGFNREGNMPGYGPDGATYIRMARLNRELMPKQQREGGA